MLSSDLCTSQSRMCPFSWVAWDTDWVRLNWKKRPIGGDRGGVLGTVVVDIEVIKDD